MKKIVFLLTAIFLFVSINAQSVSGKLLDQNGSGLAGLQLKLYISSRTYDASSGSDGSFTFNNITDVKENELPTGYSISENYPNPFNPKTRIGITLPNSGKVKIDIYNVLGQKVTEAIDKALNTGTNYLDIELAGLPNGIYLAHITLDDKYTMTKKLMLMYGSQHLASAESAPSFSFKKTTLATILDSLIVTGASISKTIFKSLPSMIGNTLNLGSLKVTLPPPAAPTLLSPSNLSVDQSITPTLSWNAVPGATSYTLQVSTTNNFSSYVLNQSGLTTKSQQISGLSNSTQYYWRVNAVNKYGASDYSVVWSYTTVTPPNTPTLAAPADLAVEIPLSTTLYWNVSSGASSYTLQVSTNNQFSSYVINQSGLTNTNKQISGLSYFTKYYWRVSAVRGNFSSDWSAIWSFNTAGTTPQTPTLITPSNTATNVSTSPTFSWNQGLYATSYTLQISTNNSFSSFVYNQSGLTNTSQQVTGLNNSTVYYWRVRSENNYGNSNWSSIFSFTIIITIPLAPIQSLPKNNAVGVELNPTFFWDISPTATSYTLQLSIMSDFSTLVFNQSGLINTNHLINNLTSVTSYYWRVSASNSFGISSWSDSWSFTTTIIPCPGAPTVSYAGKIYNTVLIGTQCWLKENLDVGNMIQVNQNPSNNNTVEKYCYDNLVENCNAYGGLYKWNEAMAYSTTSGTKGICPTGWHVPTRAEFVTLATAVSNNSNALKTIGQGDGTNTSGFSALLAGNYNYNGTFNGLSTNAEFWSSVEYTADNANVMSLGDHGSGIGHSNGNKGHGFSVRCVKD